MDNSSSRTWGRGKRKVNRDEYLLMIIDAIPAPVFLVDEDLHILESNSAGAALSSDASRIVVGKRCCEVQQCIHVNAEDDELRFSTACITCKLKNSVEQSLKGQRAIREKLRITCSNAKAVFPTTKFVTTTPFDHQAKTVVLLVLEEMLPLESSKEKLAVCANCKKIRNDDEFWEGADQFLGKYLNLMVSHGLCPECAQTLYSKLD